VGKSKLLIAGTSNGAIKSHTYVDLFTIYSTSLTRNGQEFNLKLFDTRGQKYYDSLRPLAYPLTKVILVCFSVIDRSSFENVSEKWLPEIKHYCPHSPVILVGTKIDLRNDEKEIKRLMDARTHPVTSKEGNQMRKKIAAFKYVECSSVTKLGLEDLFEEVVKSVTPSKFEKSPIGKILKKLRTHEL
jgi:small GTP-binding protein